MSTIRGFALLSLLILSCIPAQAQSRLDFPSAGFSIAALDAAPTEMGYQVLTMSLPPSGGFSPNINVQIQPFDGSLDDYIALTHEQFDTYGLEMLSEDREDVSVTWEYSGTIQGMDLHCYARAECTAGKVYLVTGAAYSAQWGTVSATLRSCVDSFRLDDSE